MNIGKLFAEDFSEPLFVVRVHEGEEQADGYRLDFGFLEGGDRFFHAVFVERGDLTLRPHPFADGKAQLARDERGGTVPCQVVERGSVLAADLQHVPEPFRGDDGGLGALAFQ